MKIETDKIQIVGNYLFDWTETPLSEKRKLFATHRDKKIISSLSFYPIKNLMAEFPNLIGAMNGSFPGKDQTIEIFFKERPSNWEHLAQSLPYRFIEMSFCVDGFISSRVKAMIINEAYYAHHENVASIEDINRAMVYGVNYPRGPFEWVAGQEYRYARLLQFLADSYGVERYQPHPQLATFLTKDSSCS